MKNLLLLIISVSLSLFSVAQESTTPKLVDKSTLSGKWLGSKIKLQAGSCQIMGKSSIDIPTILELEVSEFGFIKIKEYGYINSWNITNTLMGEVKEDLFIELEEIKLVQCGEETRTNELKLKGNFKSYNGKWILTLSGVENTCPQWNCKYEYQYELIQEASLTAK